MYLKNNILHFNIYNKYAKKQVKKNFFFQFLLTRSNKFKKEKVNWEKDIKDHVVHDTAVPHTRHSTKLQGLCFIIYISFKVSLFLIFVSWISSFYEHVKCPEYNVNGGVKINMTDGDFKRRSKSMVTSGLTEELKWLHFFLLV